LKKKKADEKVKKNTGAKPDEDIKETVEVPETGASEKEETVEAVSETDEKEKEVEELKDRYMRLLAEYDNFRKRSRAERDNIYTDATVDNAKEWLLVVDNIDRAAEYKKDAGEMESEAEGVFLIQKQAQEVLAKLGIEEIKCEVGGEFDPNIHSAVTHIEDDSLGTQCIAAIFQKGYIKGDRVVRYALVQVAN